MTQEEQEEEDEWSIRKRIENRERITEKLSRAKSRLRDSLAARVPSEETRLKASIYSRLGAAVLSLVVGATLVISGVVLIPMMAFAYKVIAVPVAAAMITVGGAMAGAAYLWLTGPA